MFGRKKKVVIYDPRKRQDYRRILYKKNIFSSLQNGLFAYEIWTEWRFFGRSSSKDLNPDSFRNFMRVTLKQTGTQGFLIIAPVTKEVKYSEVCTSWDTQEFYESVFGYFDLREESIARLIELKDQIAIYETWIIGSCIEKLEKPTRHRFTSEIGLWNMTALLEQIDKVGSVFCFDTEIQALTIITRFYRELVYLSEELFAPLK